VSEVAPNRDLSDDSRASAFFELFIAQQASIRAFILSLVHDHNDANDLLQETAATMWCKFDQFEPGSDFVAWALTIARYKVMDYLGRRKRSRVQFNDALVGQIAQTAREELDVLDDRRRALSYCWQKLTEPNRQLLRLRYDQGMTVKAIAVRLGRSVQGLYKAMARLHEALLRCMEDYLATGEH